MMRVRRGPDPPPVAAAGRLSWYMLCGIRKPPGARATSICAGSAYVHGARPCSCSDGWTRIRAARWRRSAHAAAASSGTEGRRRRSPAFQMHRCSAELSVCDRALSSMNRDGDGVPRTQQRRPRRSYEQALPTAVQRTRGCSVEHPVSVDARHLEPGTGGATGSLAPRVAVLSPGWRGKGKGCKIRGYFRIISAAQS
jgi:hypothetical protein